MAISTNSNETHPIKAIAILGASGNIGVSVLDAMLNHTSGAATSVTILTRQSSLANTQAQFASLIEANKNLKVAAVSAYDNFNELVQVLKGQDALVSCVASFSVPTQKVVADACVAAGVKRFIPSEYGADTSDLAAVQKYLLPAALKNENVQYLATLESKGLSWSAIIVGMFFDWGLKMPGFLVGHDLPNNKAMIFDGGDKKIDVTNIATIGKAVANVLLNPDAYAASQNEYVKVNSFYVSQNEYIAVVEKYTGRPVERVEVEGAALHAKGMDMLNEQGGLEFLRSYGPPPTKPYPDGTVEIIHAALFGYGHLGRYSEGGEVKKWNSVLGLPKENLDEVVKGVLQDLGLLAH